MTHFAYIALQHVPEKRRKESIRTIRLDGGSRILQSADTFPVARLKRTEFPIAFSSFS